MPGPFFSRPATKSFDPKFLATHANVQWENLAAVVAYNYCLGVTIVYARYDIFVSTWQIFVKCTHRLQLS